MKKSDLQLVAVALFPIAGLVNAIMKGGAVNWIVFLALVGGWLAYTAMYIRNRDKW